jgi:hypothetical protein
MYFSDCIIIYMLISIFVHCIRMYYYLVFIIDTNIYIDKIHEYKNITY